MDVPLAFGAELRRLRLDAGKTIQELADAVHYSKGHLCRIERGNSRPPLSLARRCDAYFDAGGRLWRLAVPQPSDEQGEAGSASVDRREVIATGVGSLLAAGLPGAGEQETGGGVSLPAVPVFREQLDLVRRLGQSTAPEVLLPTLRAQTSRIVFLASGATGAARRDLLVIGARFAEYAGWMSQEAGEESAALRWTAEAVELARAGGDEHLAGYALVRRALIAFYKGAAQETIDLAQQAQKSTLPPRIRGLAAQREAQGHALAGDEKACLRGIERARTHLLAAEEESGTKPVLGTTHVADPASMATGWCLYELGRPREAAEVLDKECRRIPSNALRTRTRYGLRAALAHASSGEVEYACERTRELLIFMDIVPSATVRTDVRRLDRELSRFRSHRVVRDMQPALMRALRNH